MLHFARLARLDDQSAMRARFFANQMMMHAAGGQQRGNGHPLAVDAAVGEDQQRDPVGDGGRSLGPQFVHPPFEPGGAVAAAEQGRQGAALEARPIDRLDPFQVGIRQNRLIEPQQPALLGRLGQQVAF